MTATCRSCWRNCALEADSEIRDIDKLEDAIAPLAPPVARVRELISTLELCHHKAERWVSNIVEAIGLGDTQKGLGSRAPGQLHPAEQVWQTACSALEAWCAGSPAASVPLPLAGLGERSPLKEWQVRRVIEKVRSVSCPDLEAPYVWLLYSGGEGESFYRADCPERYREHEDYWLATVRTLLHDTADGEDAALSLGLAIDMLWPCHWRFVENLQIVLEAIGGRLTPDQPFAACARNITLLPLRDRMETISRTLAAFCGRSEPRQALDKNVMALLGEPTEVKRWLAASLDKTIRLQLDSPAELRAITDLPGPAWIKEGPPVTLP